ncbi:MAG: ankyrin repeat domain-containing protein, partial [Hydrogenophaga sp.]
YLEANAHDPLRPNPSLREAVLTHAKTHQPTAEAVGSPRAAANDSHWKIRALGSLAVMGLVGLLAMQFDHSTPAEQETAFGRPDLRADSVAAPETQASIAPRSNLKINNEATEPVPTASPPDPVAVAPIAPVAPPVAALAGAPAPHTDPARLPPAAGAAAPGATGPEEQASKEGAMAAEALIRTAPLESAGAAPARSALNESQQRAGRETDADKGSDDPVGIASASAPTQAPASLPPLHTATYKGDLPTVQNQIAEGANIDQRDKLGRTALMLAAMGKNQAVYLALIQGGADQSLREPSGLSAADLAKRAGNSAWLAPSEMLR